LEPAFLTMADIRDELLPPSPPKKRQLPITKKQIVLIGIILLFGLYVGNLLYGTNSILRLMALNDQAHNLATQSQALKEENAALLKTLFERKQLEGAQ